MKINDKVILLSSENYFLQGLKGKSGVILDYKEKTLFPYRVKFFDGRSWPVRWCKEEELELID